MSGYQLTFPSDLTVEAVSQIVRSLAGESRGSLLRPPRSVIFETQLRRSGVRWWAELEPWRARRLRATSEAVLPGITWTPAERPKFNIDRAIELRVDAPDRLLDVEQAEAAMRRLLGLARELKADETVLVQWQIGPWLHRSPIPPATKEQAPRTLWNLPDWWLPERDSEQVQAARAKQVQHLFATAGRIAVAGASGQRSEHLTTAALNAYQLLRSPGVGPSRRLLPTWWVRRRMEHPHVPRLGPAVRLSADEVAASIGWPIGNPLLPGVRYETSPVLPVDRRLLVRSPSPSLRIVGQSSYPADGDQAVALPVSSALRHLHALGPTGVGKSTLLAHLILNDIANQRGVVVVDPKGDLVTDVLARLPDERRDDVIVLDPADAAPVGFNPLDLHGGSARGVETVLHVLHSLWADSWGPRLGDVLHAGLLTLASTPGHTMAELPLLLTDARFRRPLVARATKEDPLGLGSFWSYWDRLSDDAQAQALAPVMNKLRAFLLRPELRAVLGQAEPRFNLEDVFRRRAALLVRLPKGQLGADGTALIGSLLMAQLWRLGLMRSSLTRTRRYPCFIYLDEFQDVLRLPLDLADVLVQARGLGIGLVMAHQHLGQLDSSIRQATLANAGSRIAFRLDHDDAAVIARRTGGQLSPDAFAGLGAYQAYASLLVDGEVTPYGSIRTTALPSTTQAVPPLLRRNRQRYGVAATETEARLRQLVGGTDQPEPGGPIGGRPKPEVEK